MERYFLDGTAFPTEPRITVHGDASYVNVCKRVDNNLATVFSLIVGKEASVCRAYDRQRKSTTCRDLVPFAGDNLEKHTRGLYNTRSLAYSPCVLFAFYLRSIARRENGARPACPSMRDEGTFRSRHTSGGLWKSRLRHSAVR